MAIKNAFPKSGGIKLNDVIEDFKYVYKGQEVKAGDFVNYINGVAGQTDYGTSTDTSILAAGDEGKNMWAVALDDTRVFILYKNPSNYACGIVLQINGATITAGASVTIATNQYAGTGLSAVALDSSRVLVLYCYGSAYYLYGMVCTINGTVITLGTDTKIYTGNYSGYVTSPVLLPNGNVFIAHSYDSSNYYLYGLVVTINGTTITAGTSTSINATQRAGSSISAVVLSNGNVFIAHAYGSTYYLYGTVCTISGTTITKSTAGLVNTDYTGNKLSACLLDNDNVCIAHIYGNSSSNRYLYGLICSVSGTSITVGADTKLSDTTYTGYYVSAINVKGKVFIAHSYGSTYYLYGIVCTVSDKTITAGTDTALAAASYMGYRIQPLLLGNGTIFIAHSNSASYYLNAQVWTIENDIPTNHIVGTEYETQVKVATTPKFDGIALSSGEGGDEIEHKDKVKVSRPALEVS